ncbi:MAG TPA: peptidoglycan bridge formation glycyltransferase FemA/FemB family protein [Candidatus Saccharimonadales bacterium]|nr:peptidoglycan bridge formation glycyltransferase FemA/FemB family protein [Candidatus Saccharimonadales bacterium]
MTEVRACNDREEWDEIVLDNGGHPLQLWGWGEVKATHGWRAERVVAREGSEIAGAAQLLIRHLPKPFKALVYIPRGPVCVESKRGVVLNALVTYVREHHPATVLTIEPNWEKADLPEGWRQSSNTILAPRTLILDLERSEEELLAVMAKKTRQYIRKSAAEVTVRQIKTATELQECLAIYKQTARRAGFALHGDDYYEDIFKELGDHSPVFAAFHGEKMVAFLWLAISNFTAFELYGGVTDEGQEARANYTLKWQAITMMKKWGISQYDLNGLINDGISAFKQGFADHENNMVGTFDFPLSPFYHAWTYGLPAAKKIIRAIKR